MSAARRIRKHLQAEQDLIELYAYLFARNQLAARAFLVESEQAFNLISTTPGIGRRWESTFPKNRELRVTIISRRFRDYLIFYKSNDYVIEIVTVLHGARDLRALIDALPDNPDLDQE